MKKTRLYIDVNYDPRKTDPESLSNGLDILMDTAMSTPGILSDYGNPRPLAFYVLNHDAPTGDNFEFTGKLKDQADPSVQMGVNVKLYGGQLVIGLDGLGDKGTQPGYGKPVLVEIWRGEPRVVVWSDINQEDPTHTISLAGASEKLRDDGDPVDPSNDVPCFPDGPPAPLKTFQFSIEGFVGGDCGDGHLVKWINAPTREAFYAWLQRQSFKIENGSSGIDDIGPYTFDDGVDLVLDENGNEIEGKIGNTTPTPPEESDKRLAPLCKHCDHFVTENIVAIGEEIISQDATTLVVRHSDGSTGKQCRYVHLEDEDHGFDHDAEPGESHPLEEWKKLRPDLFFGHKDGRIGPNSDCHHNQRGKLPPYPEPSGNRVITLPCCGIVVTLGKPDPDHPGAYLGGTISSDLHEERPEDIEGGSKKDTEWDRAEAAIDALESVILAHANAGIDIASPAYVEGIETAVQACGNNLT
jgi:hypothetical protein